MRKFLLYLLGAILLTTATWFSIQISRYGGVVTRRTSQGEIQVLDAFPISNVFNIHADYHRLLFYRGRRFEMLQGDFPYFIEVPQLHSIVFLIGTKNRPESALVLLELDSGETKEIPLGNVVIGTYGFGRKDENAIRVRYADRGRLILEDPSGSSDRSKVLLYEIDLDLRRIRRSH